MPRYIELLYLVAINVIAPQILSVFILLIPSMASRFWLMDVSFVVLQALNLARRTRNETKLWQFAYGILIALNLLAFVLLSHLTVFSTPLAIFQIVSSLQF